MKNTIYLVFCVMFFAASISAQFVSPVPVVEQEVRDGSSTKLRSIQLDRVKKESLKTKTERLGPASVNNFLEVKADFEKIQVLENNIIKTYKTGKEINYLKIAQFSDELNQSALRLKVNLFSETEETKPAQLEKPKEEKTISGDVPNLIVELDRYIGAFVNNRLFLNPKKADLKDKEKAESDLEHIILLSFALKQESEKQAKNK